MRLDVTLPDLVPSCCDDLVYAVVFNKDHQALKLVLGIYTFQTYLVANHDTFAIILNEHAERSKYYFLDIADANIAIPDNPRGEQYQVEYWRKPVAGVFDRVADELRETRRITVQGKKIVDAVLGANGVAELANIQAHASATYDSENLVLRFMAHLESNGELITTPNRCQIIVTNKDGTDIIDVTETLFLNNHAGVYSIEVPNINLPNDQVFLVKAIIRDVNNVNHNTVSYLNTWD